MSLSSCRSSIGAVDSSLLPPPLPFSCLPFTPQERFDEDHLIPAFGFGRSFPPAAGLVAMSIAVLSR